MKKLYSLLFTCVSILCFSKTIDVTPPSIVSKNPVDDAIDIPLDQTFSVTFDEPIVLESSQIIVNMYKDGSIFSQFFEGNSNISSSNSTLTFTLPGLAKEGNYSIQLMNIQDESGNEISATDQADWSFSTVPQGPSVTLFSPVNGADDVLPRVGELVMNMSEEVIAGTGELRLRIVGSNTTVKTFQMGTSDIEISGSTVTLKNVPQLGYGSSYWIQNFNFNDDAFSDLDGNTLEHWNSDATWSFSVRELIEWNGTSWVGGVPPGDLDGASIRGNYNTSTDGALNVTDLSVSGGGPLVTFVADGNTVSEISENLSVSGSGSVTVESGASLIILGTHSGNDITVKRNTTGNAGLSMIGSPIQNMNIGNIGADYTFKYNTSTQAWETATSEVIQSGEGYFVGYNETSPSIEFTGAPYTDDVTVSIPASGYKLIANPYMAPIDFDGISTMASGVTDGNVWLWDDGGFNDGVNRGGDYITINSAGVASGGSGASGNTYEGFYPSFQAFFVRGDADGGYFTFTQSMMTSTEDVNADDHHFRKSEIEKIKLSIGNESYFNELIVAFADNATEEDDFGLDAPKLEGSSGLSFSASHNENEFAILALPFYLEEIEIPLKLKVPTEGEYQLEVEELKGLQDRYEVHLVDLKMNQQFFLDESSRLALDIKQAEENRFALKMTPHLVASTNSLLEDMRIVGWSSQHLEIELAEASSYIQLMDLSGKVIYAAHHFTPTGKYVLEASLKRNQTYIIKSNDQNLKFILK